MKTLVGCSRIFATALMVTMVGFSGCRSVPESTQADRETMHASPVRITVMSDEIIRTGADRVPGINLNYLRDADSNRPSARPLTAALNALDVRWLRYPGGEKSDFMQWSVPPFTRSAPVSLGAYRDIAGDRMNFDQFIAITRAVGAEPYVVVGFDSQLRTGRTEEEWLNDAVEWVKYANITKKYRVKYWEIGNENWNHKTFRPEEVARVTAKFSKAMKSVDPSIRVGTSGSDKKWWSELLPRVSPHIDFLAISLYNTFAWKNYDHWLKHPETDLIGPARVALDAIQNDAQPADRNRLRLVVAETNAANWAKSGWKTANSLGHSLVTFETIGQLLHEPGVIAAMLWGTRWIDDTEAQKSSFYALGSKNQILPAGRALAMWTQFLESHMVRVTSGDDGVKAFASRSTNGKNLTVWILNRANASKRLDPLTIEASRPYRVANHFEWSGRESGDSSPVWKSLGTIPVEKNRLSPITVPPTSVTVLQFQL